ncbi:EAL domain-containing protein [Sulfurimonas sp.]
MTATLKNYFNTPLNINLLLSEKTPSELTRLSIVIVPMIIGPISFIWAVIYFSFGLYLSASIPFFYCFISLVNLLHYAKTKDLLVIKKTQMFLILFLPFLLMWSLGGFAQGSYVMVWAFFAPIGALIHDKKGKSEYWLYAFILLVIISLFLDPWLMQVYHNQISPMAQEIFFFLNISAAMTGLYLLLKYFIYEKDLHANYKLKAKHKELLKYNAQLKNSISYLESYKNSIDQNLIVTRTDIFGKITFANENFYNVSGYKAEEIIGKNHNIVKHPSTPKALFDNLWSTILNKKTWHGRIQNMRKDGSGYWIDTTISPILDKDENIVEFIAIRHNISKLLKQQQELSEMLYIDSLTSLKNRNALLRDKRSRQELSVILINIDRFSQINDLYGEKFGNKVLLAFAQLLERTISNIETAELYRLSGDEFVILSEHINPIKLANLIALITNTLDTQALIIEEQEISLHVTIGVSYEENSQLLPTANMAIKAARKKSRSVVFYTKKLSLSDEYENNLKWIKEIKNAIIDDRVVVYYQAIVDNDTNRVTKYETLIRLLSKDGSIITPENFLEIAKKSKLYKELTKIVIAKSFEAFKNTDYSFSINITIEDILDKNIKAYIEKTLQQYKISHRVVFEIVESESIENFDKVESFIKMVKEYGCKISIDDFGTGYSNFEHLMRLQVDYIKIDGSIIKNIVDDKRSELITSVIVAFAKEMNITTIGEYVDSKEIHEKLVLLGVNKSQGYYFCEPKATL